MSAPAVLIASAKLRSGEDQAFAAWQARHNIVIGKFPGFISSDVIPPSQPESNEWTIVLNFRSQDELTAFQLELHLLHEMPQPIAQISQRWYHYHYLNSQRAARLLR